MPMYTLGGTPHAVGGADAPPHPPPAYAHDVTVLSCQELEQTVTLAETQPFHYA